MSFRAEFDHAQHLRGIDTARPNAGCAACHTPANEITRTFVIVAKGHSRQGRTNGQLLYKYEKIDDSDSVGNRLGSLHDASAILLKGNPVKDWVQATLFIGAMTFWVWQSQRASGK